METRMAGRRELWGMAGSFALLTLLFWTMIMGGLAAGFGVIWLFAVGAAVWYMKGADDWQNSLSAKLCLAGSVLFTPVYGLTNHVGVTIVLFLAQGCALLLWISLVSGHGGTHRQIANLLSAAGCGLIAVIAGLFELGEGLADYRIVRRAEKAEKEPGKRSFPWGIVAGILLALPAIGILLPILASADAAFDGMIDSVGRAFEEIWSTVFNNVAELVIALVLAAIFFYPVIGMLFYLRTNPTRQTSAPKEVLSGSFLIGFYGSISFLCLAYLFSQLSYFFNGFLGILPEELTAAEYARRGFFELFAFAMVTLVLLSVGICLAKRDRLSKVFSGLLIFLCSFNLVLISTALAKMVLYVNLYGLTPKRLVASAIMIFLAVVFVILILGRIFQNFRSLPVMLAAALILVGAVTYMDPDRIVAEYNVGAWENGKLSTVDAVFLGDLSDAAIPALIRVYESEDDAASEAAAKELCRIYFDKCDDYQMQRGKKLPVNDNVFAYNVTEHIANNAINEILDTLPLEVYQ